MKLEQENDMWICGTCILILIVEMASKPFSDFYVGPFVGGLDSDDFLPPALVCPESPRRSVGEIGYCFRFEPRKILIPFFC
jgi:hypothetical protein